MRRIARAALRLALAGLVAAPALAAPGLRLSWDHCYADGQVVNRSFACNTNTGSQVLDFSFESPVAASDRTGIELTVHFTSSDGSGTLPAWWQAASSPSCRTGLQIAVADPGSIGCDQPIPALGGAGGLTTLAPLSVSPAVWRMLAAVAVPGPATFTVGPGTETFAMQLIVRNVRTVGTGACAGCSTPICIGFGMAKITESTGFSPITILAGGPNTGGGPANVTWQGAYTSHYAFNGSGVFADFSCAPTLPVPVRASTWGALKALYR